MEKDEALIEAVRDYQCLYISKSADFRRSVGADTLCYVNNYSVNRPTAIPTHSHQKMYICFN